MQVHESGLFKEQLALWVMAIIIGITVPVVVNHIGPKYRLVEKGGIYAVEMREGLFWYHHLYFSETAFKDQAISSLKMHYDLDGEGRGKGWKECSTNLP